MNTILITGVTGHLGKSVINLLLNKTAVSNLAVLARDASKAEDLKAKGVEIRQADYKDYHSLVAAFMGIDKLYFVSGSDDFSNRASQHANVVKAAKEAGAKHIIYTSFQRKNETETSPIALVTDAHLKTEKLLKDSGMSYTILKHNFYMDMLPMFIGDKIFETGSIYLPAGEGKASYTLRNDMAEVASIILTTEGHENKIYDITNDKTVSFTEIAAIISQVSGKTINYVSPTQAEYIQTLSGAGVPMEYVRIFSVFCEAIKQTEFDQTNNIIETLTGRKPVSITQFLQQVYTSKK